MKVWELIEFLSKQSAGNEVIVVGERLDWPQDRTPIVGVTHEEDGAYDVVELHVKKFFSDKEVGV